MKKTVNLIKYFVFALICLCTITFSVNATAYGTLSPGAVKTSSHAWWDVFDCTTSQEGPFTVEVVNTPNYTYKSYNRKIRITIDDYVPRAYTNVKVTCTYYDVDQGSAAANQGRIFSNHVLTHTFSVAAGGTPTTLTNDKEYNLYQNQTIDLTDKLGISKIESFKYSSGSGNGTIGYSGCAVGSKACVINFTKGTPVQNRKHTFIIKYQNTAGRTYETTVYVYEQATTRTDNLGTIEPGEHTFSIFDIDVSNFKCSKVTSGPYTVASDLSGNSGRIKITSDNYSLTTYSSMQAKCTFTKNGVGHTTYYNFKLSPIDAVAKDKEYTAKGGETFNIWSDLKIKQIISSSVAFTENGTTTGCYVGNTKCSVKMGNSLTDGKTTTSILVYYDTSNVLTQSYVSIKEVVPTYDIDLGEIGVGNTAYATIAASGVTCTNSTNAPYTANVTAVGSSYKLSVTNNNKTVNTYENQLIKCTGTPAGVSGSPYKYNYTFKLSAETNPIKDSKSYELLPGEMLNFTKLYGIASSSSYKFTSGGSVYTINGCKGGSQMCDLTFTGSAYKHNRTSTLVLTYINPSAILYETTVTLIEKDPSQTTKAYPGLMGFCDFNDDWEYTQWSDASGKQYAFYEATKKGAVLPDCKSNAQNGRLFEFKGWSKGYKAGDILDTSTTCKNLVSVGSATSFGENYAPCYELVPHVRLATNGGTIETNSTWSFNQGDMTYIATGPSINTTVKLPDVKYSGFHANSKLKFWQNSDTGEIKYAGSAVKLDGGVWLAVADVKTTQVDLYKTIGLNSTELFTVEGMTSCSLSGGASSYVSAMFTAGDCQITGKAVTPFETFADVKVSLSDGSTRTYKFTVEDRTGTSQNGNDAFIVDTSKNVVIGENDTVVTDGIYTDQCNLFSVSNQNYKTSKIGFATSKKTGEILYSGAYHVASKCPSDTNTYVAFCLDPGRRGPGETGAGGAADYIKASDVNLETDFGKIIAYVVKNMGIKDFGNYGNEDADNRRAASHVSLRISAIKNGLSTAVDSADLVYATHYYPYEAVAAYLKTAANDGDITTAEASTAVNYEYNGNGMNWGSTRYQTIRDKIIKILSEYDGSTGAEADSAGFERTITKTDVISTNGGKGYQITYTGTITLPTGGSNAKLTACSSSNGFGVTCHVDSFTDSKKTASGNRKIYNYQVRILATNASNVKVPQGNEDQKKLGFKLTYDGGSLVQAAFIANPKSGSDSLQRMLILTTSSPSVFVYWDIVPNSCDFDFLDPDTCLSKNTCSSTFNEELFVAAGCCKYLLNTTKYDYILKNFCEQECTHSTLTSTCAYNTKGGGYADFYEIREGHSYSDKAQWEPAIGKCVVQVTQKYVNDNATNVENITNANKFIYHDDASNLINVDAYKNNRYCQVTCKEDWDLSMDAFGSFVGEKAVAAGTYFQIVENDMFISGTRMCYSTFINYDRFMANIVDISNELVQAYNDSSKWSHVWTDIKEQKDANYSTASKITNNQDAPVCVEFADKCPAFNTNYVSTAINTGTYFWEASQVDGGNKGGCLQVPQYGNSGAINDSSCSTTRAGETGYRGDDYSDSVMKYKNGGQNNYNERCTFTRTYCPGNNEPYGTQELIGKNCYYYDYEMRDSKAKVWGTPVSRPTKTCAEGVTGPCYKSCSTLGSGYTSYGTSQCRKKVCPAGYGYEIGGTCYKSTCPTGYSYTSVDKKYCRKYTYTNSETHVFTYRPKYKETYLRCKVFGKAVDYTLKTKDTVKVTNSEGQDIYYNTKEFDPVAMASKSPDNNTQNDRNKKGEVQYNYGEDYTHQCTITQGVYQPNGAVGTSECHQTSFQGSYNKTNDMFCTKFAPTSSNTKAFCYVGEAGNNETDGKQNYSGTGYHADDYRYSDETNAFKYMTDNMLTESEKNFNKYKNIMMSKHSLIYSHAYDMFDCQHFQLHNNTDDMDTGRTNNSIKNDKIMGQTRSYVKILTEFKPSAAYTYDEESFMTILEDDNILEQFTEKNDAIYGGEDAYAKTTNASKKATVKTANGTKNVDLNRNYLQFEYYNPDDPWTEKNDPEAYAEYKDPANEVTSAAFPNERASKKIVMCSIGTKTFGTGYYEGKEGAVIAFSLVDGTPKWVGGRCYQVTVDYKKVHYVKNSISNSSYYKNKGYWYVRGGDIKEHGDDFEDALKNANARNSGNNYSVSKEKGRWSRLGSFNVFPISMGTPRNLYQYTYTFGQIGSYYDGKLGRIMGTSKSIIQDNTRTCFYEVFEEVCLCCGYRLDPGDLVTNYIGTNGNFYTQSDSNKMDKNYDGTLAIYTNSVSLGDLDQGRDGNVASNWKENQKFMYNGNSNLTTDKGSELKKLIENKGEAIYASKPEYAYYLTPDTLKEIRNYNDAVGYELNYNNLKVYEASKIACKTTACNDKVSDIEEVINFQHYGSKFLIGEVTQNININNYAYGTVTNNTKDICEVTKSTVKKVTSLMESGNCRWVDYIETENSYTDPATKETAAAFRLAFK